MSLHEGELFADSIVSATASAALVTSEGEIMGVIATGSNAAAKIAIFHDSGAADNEIFRLTTIGADLGGPMSEVMPIPFKVDTGLYVEIGDDQSVTVFIRRGDTT